MPVNKKREHQMDKCMKWMQWEPGWGELRGSLGTEGPFPEVGGGGKVALHHSLHLLLPTFSRPDAQNGVCQCRRRDAALSDFSEGILLF